ncbi:MAG: hypothetical protein JO266_19815, partial [Acidobacteria bacterium]|nr:hypothetical protein [Acidobacteriota bacterium]
MAAWLNDNQLWSRAASRVERSWAKFSFDRVAAKLLNTEPLPIQGDSPLFLSLICHRDIISYLAAIKSLYVQFGRGRVLVVDDGSLTARDQGILSYHIPGVKFVDLKTIQTGPAPRADFFWERLVKIIQLTSDNYVIQLDADTLVSDSIPEVVQCWKDNKSFLLGTDAGKSIS